MSFGAFATGFSRWQSRVLLTYVRVTQPSPSGLPNWRVLLWFPLLAVFGAAILIALQISGTSSGVHWFNLGTGEDPRLLLGNPRQIRSDEWLVQQSWVVAQSNSGYGDTNFLFPGGSDMTLLNELPSWHWSSLFRPHLWGYLLFGLDVGVAWHWWVPAILLVSGCYLFMVTMLPKRPMTAALFAVAIYFTPVLQWFYTPSAVMPIAWALLAMTGVIFVLVDQRGWVRITWSVIVGYTAVTMAMGLYLPFMLPCVFVFLAFAVGYFLRVRPWATEGARGVWRRLGPLVSAGVAAGAVTIGWVMSRWSTFDAIQSTVYPGQRSLSTGQILVSDPLLTGLFSAPWSQTLRVQSTSILGDNSSSASSAVLLVLFVFPALVWFAIRSFRRSRPDWLLISIVAIVSVFAAYLFVPGWDDIARLLLLDRIAPERFRVVFVLLTPVAAALIIENVDRLKGRKTWILGLVCAIFTGAILASVGSTIAALDSDMLALASSWRFTVPAIVLAVLLLFIPRLVPTAAALLLTVGLVATLGVNPVYRGIFDLSETKVGQAVQQTDDGVEGTWIAVGSYESMAIVMQSGVESFSGVQNYPSKEMWHKIDPKGSHEEAWNRLAHVQWALGTGPVDMSNPQADIVLVTVDPCSPFAQSNLDFILSDAGELVSECLVPVSAVKQGNLQYRIYEVVPAS